MIVTTSEPISIEVKDEGPDSVIFIDNIVFATISGLNTKNLSIYQVREYVEKNYKKSGYKDSNYQQPMIIPENDWFRSQ